MHLSARGGWIEIPSTYVNTPSWESLPARGGWIEISCFEIVKTRGTVSPLHGESRLKLVKPLKLTDLCGRISPQGESGLKFFFQAGNLKTIFKSLPARGEWIETQKKMCQMKKQCISPHGESGLK